MSRSTLYTYAGSVILLVSLGVGVWVTMQQPSFAKKPACIKQGQTLGSGTCCSGLVSSVPLGGYEAICSACGNGKCEKTKGETSQTCLADCPNPCGNGKCEKAKGETTATCPQDCPNPCGNGICEKSKGETCGLCSQDCTCPFGKTCNGMTCKPIPCSPDGTNITSAQPGSHCCSSKKYMSSGEIFCGPVPPGCSVCGPY